MSLRVIQQSDEKSVTEEYGFKKEVLSNGPNSGTLSRDIQGPYFEDIKATTEENKSCSPSFQNTDHLEKHPPYVNN